MEAYSRDSLASPLRALQAVLLQVAVGTFLPDATRSGQLVEEGSETGSSSASAASSAGSDDAVALEPLEEEQEVRKFLVNARSGVVHLAANGLAACGKPCPKHGVPSEIEPEGAIRCRRCF